MQPMESCLNNKHKKILSGYIFILVIYVYQDAYLFTCNVLQLISMI